MKRLVSLLLLVLGTTAVLYVTWWLLTVPREAGAPPQRPPYMLPATLATVVRGEIAPRVAVTGSVLSTQRALLGFEVAGRLRELKVREGDDVAAGTVLAALEDGDQRAQLARAQSAAALAQRELERWLAGSRGEEKRRLAAQLEVRKAEAELALREVERGRELVGTNVISKSQFDQLLAQTAVATSRVDAAEEELAQAEAGTREEDIEVYRAQLALALAEVQIAEQELAKTELRAPAPGNVVKKLVSVGDSVDARAPVYELVDMGAREIELEIPAHFAGQLAAGAPMEASVDEAPGFRLKSRIDVLLSVADQSSRNFRALVRLDEDEDPEQVLKPGSFVRAWIDLTPLRDRLLVPEDAVRILPSGTIVVRAAPAPPPPEGAPAGGPPAPPFVADWVPVRLLGSFGGLSAIEPLGESLEAGDQVVMTGVDLAFPGVPLLPRMAERAVQGGGEPAGAAGGDAPGEGGAHK